MSQDILSSPALFARPEPQSARLDIDVAEASPSTAHGYDGYDDFTFHRQDGKRTTAQQLRTNRSTVSERNVNDLHPYVQTLSLSNLDSCVALENAVFSEEERCSREKVGTFRNLIS